LSTDHTNNAKATEITWLCLKTDPDTFAAAKSWVELAAQKPGPHGLPAIKEQQTGA
jgi:hypothetical protein